MEFIAAESVFDLQFEKHRELINIDLEIVFKEIYNVIDHNAKDNSVTLEFAVSGIVQQKLKSLGFQVSTFEFPDHGKTIISWCIV